MDVLQDQSQDKSDPTCSICKGQVPIHYHCATCDAFDLCLKCYDKDGHPHKMQKLGVDLENASSSGDQNKANSQETKSVNIQRCSQLMSHACECRDASCVVTGCQKMKRVVQHSKICERKAHGGCPICRQLVALCCYHAKYCQGEECSVPFCFTIKKTRDFQRFQLQARLQQAVSQQRRMVLQDAMLPALPVPEPNIGFQMAGVENVEQPNPEMAGVENVEQPDPEIAGVEIVEQPNPEMGGVENVVQPNHEMAGVENVVQPNHEMAGGENVVQPNPEMAGVENVVQPNHEMAGVEIVVQPNPGMAGVENIEPLDPQMARREIMGQPNPRVLQPLQPGIRRPIFVAMQPVQHGFNPRAHREVLHQLLNVLRSPNMPDKQERILHLLRSNPQLMAAFITQRRAFQSMQRKHSRKRG